MIRAFDKNDLPTIMRIWLDANIKAHSFIPEKYWTDNYEAVQRVLPQAQVYVYENNANRIDGFIGLSNDYIEGIFVREGVRSNGIGKQMLNYAKRMKSKMSLRVYQKNIRAIRFYQREQFTIQAEGVDENTGEKEFVMIWKNEPREVTGKNVRKISLFIAMSLDGYIADSKGGVDWLNGQGNDDENIDAYSEFAKTIDTVLMGWNTYHQIVSELSPEKWIYGNFTTYVITHNAHNSSENIRFVNENPVELVRRLKKEAGKDVWICGGANIVGQLVNEDLIDNYHITVIPTLLGSAIRLFENAKHEIKLRLLKTRSYNGMTDLINARRYGVCGGDE